MTRFVFAVVLLVVLGSSAIAQPPAPPPPAPPPPVPQPVPLIPIPNPSVIPPPPTYNGPPGPAIPYHKSGGVVVGTEGYYPYDTGLWLLAGTGVTRQSGFYTMVYPGGNVPAFGAIPVPAGRSAPHGKHGIFRR